MRSGIVIKTVWLLAMLEMGYASAIIPESLDSRLCRAVFVFKFQVLSGLKDIGCAGSPLKTVEYVMNTTLTSPPSTTEATTSQPTIRSKAARTTATATETAGATLPSAKANTTTGKTSSLRRILSTQPSPTKQQLTNLSTSSSFQTRRKRSCIQLQAQLISIRGDGVFKGEDTLKKMNNIVESKDNYYSYVRPDLNWERELSIGEYLFIGRIKGVFLSNPATVVPWNKTLETKINNFDFATDCKKQKQN